jgi:hypothetical protein
MLLDRGEHLRAVLVGDALLHERGHVAVVTLPGALERGQGIARRARRLAEAPEREPVLRLVVQAEVLRGRHRRLRADADGSLTLRQPTLFLDLIPATKGTSAPSVASLPDRDAVEVHLVQQALNPFLAEVSDQRLKENRIVGEHIEISLQELINRQQIALADLLNRRVGGENIPGLEGNIKQAEDHLDELNARLERRRQELEMERHCSIGDVQHMGRAWVMPHPEREAPGIAPLVSDPEIEKIAVRIAMEHERARG